MSLHHITEILQIVFILFSAIILHEIAHGWVALKLGDPTAKDLGRLTLNPIKHMDPVGSVILPGFLILLRLMGHPVFIFGWAKPVPVNFARLKNPKRGMMFVALAGPLVNIAIAVVCAGLLRSNLSYPDRYFFELAITINVFLALFNMVPVPPLDGSRVVMSLLPNRMAAVYARLEPYGILIVIALLWLGALDQLVLPAVEIIIRWLGVGL